MTLDTLLNYSEYLNIRVCVYVCVVCVLGGGVVLFILPENPSANIYSLKMLCLPMAWRIYKKIGRSPPASLEN